MEGNFLDRLRGIVNKTETLSVKPSILPTSESVTRKAVQTMPPVATKPELIPGNFYSFEFFIELQLGDAVHLGFPKVCVRDAAGRTRWGSNIEWSVPNPTKARAAWIDDEQRGIASRTLTNVEDVLGAEGKIGDMHLRFEKVLDLGQNQVVYALFCEEKNIRLAYGFDRRVFEPTYKKPVTNG